MTNDRLVSRGEEIARRLDAEHRAKTAAAHLHAVEAFQPISDPFGTDGCGGVADAPHNVFTDDDQEHRPPSLLSEAFTAAELQHMRFDPLREFVPKLITEGAGMLVGGPKIGKSWLAMNIALGCAFGGMVLGKISVEECDVLYLALEDGKRRLQSRIRQLQADQEWPSNLTFLTVVEQGQVIATLKEWYRLHPRSLAILDTLSKNRGQRRAGADAYLDDYAFGSRLKHVVDSHAGSALLCVHHDRKQHAEDFVERISGTNGLAGAMDYLLLLDRKRQSNEAVIHVTGRDVSENEYALQVDNGCWELDGMDILDAAATIEARRERQRESKLGSRSLDAVKFVNSRQTTSPTELAEHLHIDNKIAGNVLAGLAKGDYIRKDSRGTYTPLPSETSESGENAGQRRLFSQGTESESGESGETDSSDSPVSQSGSENENQP